MPGIKHDPGKNAGYRSGKVSRQLAVLHYTVGIDSQALIRNNGLAQFLVPKEALPIQFAEADAVCAHACEWNVKGPGIEFERLSDREPLTASQIAWGGKIIRWLHDTYGYPLKFHDGARLPLGDPFRGFVTHRSLVHKACDQHTDYVTATDFARMVNVATLDIQDAVTIKNVVSAELETIETQLHNIALKLDAMIADPPVRESLFRRFFRNKSDRNP